MLCCHELRVGGCVRVYDGERETETEGEPEGEIVYRAYVYMACINIERFWKAAKKLLGVHAAGEWG